MGTAIKNFKRIYNNVGIACVPVAHGLKYPTSLGWQERTPQELWDEMGDQAKNIAALGGNGHAFVDTDDEQTPANVLRLLDGLGLKQEVLPSYTSASGLPHYVLAVKHAPTDRSVMKFRSDIGTGELRFGRGSNTLLPPSCTVGRTGEWGRYKWDGSLSQSIAKIQRLSNRPIEWKDLAPLLSVPNYQRLENPPVGFYMRGMNDKARGLLNTLSQAIKGRAIWWGETRYDSRSDAEQAVITSLILSGYTLDEIESLFEQYLPSHYREKSKNSRKRYLAISYQSAVSYLVYGTDTRGKRNEISTLYQQVLQTTDLVGLDRMVYLGILAQGFYFGTDKPGVSIRDLEEFTGADEGWIRTSLRRLLKMDLIDYGLIENGYRIITINARNGTFVRHIITREPYSIGVSSELEYKDRSENIEYRIRDIENTVYVESPSERLVWGMLGKGTSYNSEAIWRVLSDDPKTASEISDMVGIERHSASRQLKVLSGYGLAKRVSSHKWVAGDTALSVVAKELGCDRKLSAIQSRIQEERIAYRAMLSQKQPVGKLSNY